MEKMKWVVCGASGLAGRKVVRDGLVAANNCVLCGIHSIDKDEAKIEADKYNVPGFTSVEKMISELDCDAVYIATPQFVHLEEVEIGCRYKKHILCEKPLATKVEDVERIVHLGKKAGICLGTDFNYRFHPLHQQMRELIQSGAIGQVISGRCQFGQDYPPQAGAFRQKINLSGGGAFSDMGNHAVDLLEYIMGRTTVSVTGLIENVIYSYECEDSGVALLDFKEGGFGLVDTYFCSPIDTLRNDVEINGTKGTIYTENTLQMKTTGRLHLRTRHSHDIFDCPNDDMYKIIFEAFTHAALAGLALPVTGEDGLHSQKIIEAVYKSSETGSRITVV